MANRKNSNNIKGFSLFELLITMGIMMLLALIVFPVTIQKAQQSKLESYASQLVTDIYYQQQRAALKGIEGGIYLSTNSYTLFDGPSLSEAVDTDIKRYPSNIRISSVEILNREDIFFNKGEFKPYSYGTLIISDGQNNIRVYINREGLIGYENI